MDGNPLPRGGRTIPSRIQAMLYNINVKVFAHILFLSMAFLAPLIRGMDKPIVCVQQLLQTCKSKTDRVPFEIKAQFVRRLHTEGEIIAIQDDSGAAFVKLSRKMENMLLRPGDLIVLAGVTIRQDPYPTVAQAQEIRVTEHLPAPLPQVTSLAELSDPTNDYRYLKISGTITEAFRDEIDDNCYFLLLTDGHRTITSTVVAKASFEAVLRSLHGAQVTLSGMSNPTPLTTRLKHGTIFYINGPESIEIRVPAPTDPFSIAGRTCVKGKIIAVWHRNQVLIRTFSNEICRASVSCTTLPKYGDIVEAAGSPATDLYHDNLTRAIWRPTIADIPPESPPVDTTPQHILSVGNDGTRGINPTFHGRAIRLTGTVRGRPSSDGHLTLACGDRLVPVDATALDQAFSDVLDGSRVSISGTCVMEIPNWHADEPFPHIEGITLVPRTADDIVILARPPWWTVARLFTAIGILLLAMLFVLIWNVALRKRAELRGRELLKEQLEHVKADLKIEERSRLSVELHDSLAQNLAGVSMEIEAANLLKAEDPNAMSEHLLAAAQTLQSCRDELRNCLWDLRSQALEETDMNTAIRRTLLPHVKNTHVAVRFNIPRSELPDNVAHAILQVIRELTVNAIRHGRATSIRIAGDLTDKILMFSVSDNGRGFDPTNRPGVAQGHFGLQGIRERIQKLSGTVRIDSQIGHGTKAVVILAVAEPKGEAPQNSET